MARTSRKQRKRLSDGMGNPRKETDQQTVMEKIYRTALYIRLSVLDSGKKDSDTVETQESLLRQFLEGKSCFSIVDVYVDNGETGVDFKRDEFERLMEDVRGGRVDCIIVEDLSRFGAEREAILSRFEELFTEITSKEATWRDKKLDCIFANRALMGRISERALTPRAAAFSDHKYFFLEMIDRKEAAS